MLVKQDSHNVQQQFLLTASYKINNASRKKSAGTAAVRPAPDGVIETVGVAVGDTPDPDGRPLPEGLVEFPVTIGVDPEPVPVGAVELEAEDVLDAGAAEELLLLLCDWQSDEPVRPKRLLSPHQKAALPGTCSPGPGKAGDGPALPSVSYCFLMYSALLLIYPRLGSLYSTCFPKSVPLFVQT